MRLGYYSIFLFVFFCFGFSRSPVLRCFKFQLDLLISAELWCLLSLGLDFNSRSVLRIEIFCNPVASLVTWTLFTLDFYFEFSVICVKEAFSRALLLWNSLKRVALRFQTFLLHSWADFIVERNVLLVLFFKFFPFKILADFVSFLSIIEDHAWLLIFCDGNRIKTRKKVLDFDSWGA